MSKCISSHGEYSDHEPGDPCPYCGEYDMARIIAERDKAEARMWAVRDMVDRHEAEARAFWQMNGKPNADTGGISIDRIRRTLDGV